MSILTTSGYATGRSMRAALCHAVLVLAVGATWPALSAAEGDPAAAVAPAANRLAAAANPAATPPLLPEIIVLAAREPAPVQSLPLSVTAVPRTTIADAGMHTVKEAAAVAPNVFMNEFSARKLSNPYFRGIGSSPQNPGVTTFIDGVPQLNASSSSIEFVDVDQVEFVRGPQGALFGRNTAGGLINVTSRLPAANWRTEMESLYGNYAYRDLRLAVSGPLTKTQRLSLAGGWAQREGYTQNDFTGHDLDSREAYFGKGQYLLTLAPDWDVRLIFFREHDDDGDYALGDLAAIRKKPHHVTRDFEGHTRRDIAAPTLLINHHGEVADFSSTTGLVWWKTRDLTDLDYTALPLMTRDNRDREIQFTQDLRLASAADTPLVLADALKLKWQAGVSLFTQAYDQKAVTHFAPFVLGPPFAVDQWSPRGELRDYGLGVYGQTTLTAWNKLDLILGVRGDYEHKTAELATFFEPAIAPPVYLDTSEAYTNVTPQFGLAYHLTPHQAVYAMVSEGYKAGGFNPVSPAGCESYAEESSWNYEVGAKTSWLNERLALNIAAFYIQWDDLQLNMPMGGGAYYIANAGAASSRGLELELTARPLAGWELFGGVGVADAHFLSDAVNNGASVGGNRLPYTPTYTANAGTQYSLKISNRLTAYVRAEALFFGAYEYSADNTENQDSYNLVSVRTGLRGDSWFVEVWLQNAFDTEYVPLAFAFPTVPSGFIGECGAPRTYGLRAGLQF